MGGGFDFITTILTILTILGAIGGIGVIAKFAFFVGYPSVDISYKGIIQNSDNRLVIAFALDKRREPTIFVDQIKIFSSTVLHPHEKETRIEPEGMVSEDGLLYRYDYGEGKEIRGNSFTFDLHLEPPEEDFTIKIKVRPKLSVEDLPIPWYENELSLQTVTESFRVEHLTEEEE